MARPLQSSPVNRYRWASWGDLNAFFGLMLDNVANLVLTVSLLATVYRFPPNFALHYMIPGTAAGVLIGDLIYTWMAFRLARRTGRHDVTAMPLGLDTPSTFGMVFFVLGPAYLDALGRGLPSEQAAHFAWQIGICATLASGLFKLLCAVAAGWIRNNVPRAGLLGSLTAIALVLISFLPLLEIMRHPLVGLLALVVILTTLVARVELPWRIPGALGALLVGGGLYYSLRLLGAAEAEPMIFSPRQALLPAGWLEAWRGGWVAALGESLRYLPIVLPFALGTVVGGIDCTESAAAAGDEYHTGRIVAVEGLATVLAALCGGVIQTTPYIGHPAYKAMGGRAAYTLATALFVGGAGMAGYFGYMYLAIPKAAIYPVLVFIGVEIASQSFHATPARHYAAVAMACVPAMAYLVAAFTDRLLAAAGTDISGLADKLLAHDLQTLRMLAGGFIITSLLWSSALAMLIDRRLLAAAGFLLTASACSLLGIIHSPYRGSPLALPWRLPEPLPPEAASQSPWILSAAYASMALLLVAWHIWLAARGARPKL